MGVPIGLPDVNASGMNFEPDGRGGIRFGLSAIRNVGEGAVSAIITERETNGPYIDFHDFCARVNPDVLNKRTVESLAKSGAFSGFGHTRLGLVTSLEQIIDRVTARRKERDRGMVSFFDLEGTENLAGDADTPVPIPTVEYARAVLLSAEKEMLGAYVSDHPVRAVEAELRRRAENRIGAIIDPDSDEFSGGEFVTVGGVISGFVAKFTKRGDQMAAFHIEDDTGSIKAVVFPNVYKQYAELLCNDALVVVRARVEIDDRDDPGARSLHVHTVDRLTPPDPAKQARRFTVRVPADPTSAQLFSLKRVLTDPRFAGDTRIYLCCDSIPGMLRLPDEFRVDPSNPELVAAVRVLFGSDAVTVHR
jgi:DNA polymerase-3 subunit alpha